MPKPSAKKKPTTKKSAAKKTSRLKPSAARASRSTTKTKCTECGAAAGTSHAVDCPNGHCIECHSTLGHMLTCSHHPNFKGVVLDGKTGEVLETTVDGKDAKIDTTPAPPKKSRKKKSADAELPLDLEDPEDDDAEGGIRRLPPPKLADLAIFEALQYGLDQKIIFGIKQPLTKSKPCDEEWFDDASEQSVGCSAVAAFDFEVLDTCAKCKHTKKAVRGIKCISHMGLRIVGELKDRQIDMFEDDR